VGTLMHMLAQLWFQQWLNVNVNVNVNLYSA